MRGTFEERFEAKIDRRGDGCHPWMAARLASGYGVFTVPGKGLTVAHRIAYELHVGPIPPGLVIDHLCHNRWCCKTDPDALFPEGHLKPTTSRENFRRGRGAAWQLNAAKTHCFRGHEFTPENTYRWKENQRQCIACRRITAAARAAEAWVPWVHYNSRKTHCPRGHEYTPDNTYVRNGRRTSRSCKACKREKFAEKLAART